MFTVDSQFMNLSNVTSYISMLPATRYLLIIFNILIVLLGVFGNSIVLFVSKKYNALKMDKVSVVLLESLAAADILTTLMAFLPMGVTLIADQWVLGEVLCGFGGYFAIVPVLTEIYLIMTITCHRLHVLNNSLRTGTLESKTGYIISSVIWGFAFFLALLGTIQNKITFRSASLNCYSVNTPSDHGTDMWTQSFLVLTVFLIPTLTLVFGNFWILFIVAESHGRVGERALPGRKAVITTALVSGCFILSYGPYIMAWVSFSSGHKWPLWATLSGVYGPSFNVVINPFIYYWRNTGFRRTVKNLLLSSTHDLELAERGNSRLGKSKGV